MQITVNVDNVDLNTIIGEQISYDEDGARHSEGGHTIADEVIDRLVKHIRADKAPGIGWSGLQARVAELRDEAIRERIAAEIDAAFAKPIAKTNSYGEPTGQTSTLTELIVAEVHKYLDGRADRYSSSNSKTRAQAFIEAAVEKVVAKELAEAVADEKAKAVAAVRAKAADLIADAVKQGIGR